MKIPEHFHDLFEPELVQELANKASLVHIKAGDAFLQSGEVVKVMPILLSGVLRISRVENDGRELFLYYINPDESCAMTFTCCMERLPSEIRAVAEEDAEMLTVPMESMDEWLVKYPTWKNFVMKTIPRGDFPPPEKTGAGRESAALPQSNQAARRTVTYVTDPARVTWYLLFKHNGGT